MAENLGLLLEDEAALAVEGAADRAELSGERQVEVVPGSLRDRAALRI